MSFRIPLRPQKTKKTFMRIPEILQVHYASDLPTPSSSSSRFSAACSLCKLMIFKRFRSHSEQVSMAQIHSMQTNLFHAEYSLQEMEEARAIADEGVKNGTEEKGLLGLHQYQINDDIFAPTEPSDMHVLTSNYDQLTTTPTFIKPLLSSRESSTVELVTYNTGCRLKVDAFQGNLRSATQLVDAPNRGDTIQLYPNTRI